MQGIILVLLFVTLWMVSNTEAAAIKKPRIRKEWRKLSKATRMKVATGMWILKNTTTAVGRQMYGPNFNNHDEMLMLHACSVYDTRCDNGHYGPHFMTFHRAFLLKYERALLAVDPSIGALPYWNIANDAVGGKYRNDPEKYIYTDNFFGNYWTNSANGYAVSNGLFANFPITEYTRAKFGKDSWMAKDNKCIREEWFVPKKCDQSNPTSKTFLRDHDDCTPYVARNPLYVAANAKNGGLGGSYELVFTPKDFAICNNVAFIAKWMDWQNCIEFATEACSVQAHKSLMKNGATLAQNLDEFQKQAEGKPHMEASLAQLRVALSTLDCNTTNLMGSYVKDGAVKLVNFFHSMVHIKNGLDLADVTTSPNDISSFTGHHANVDRSLMIWQRRTTKKLSKTYWGYPSSSNDLKAAGQSAVTISGPFSTYDVLSCANSTSFPDYHPFESAWIPGTWLDEVVNGGFAFKNLFDCKQDEIDSTGHLIKCNGTDAGYTHRELLYWTAPGRAPYIYDDMPK
jgi:hypothetical protein